MSLFPIIDIIIPAYKAQDTIIRTLSSIALQEIVDEVEVTIVNDADGIGYQKFVDMFSPYMKIREIVVHHFLLVTNWNSCASKTNRFKILLNFFSKWLCFFLARAHKHFIHCILCNK